jgi:hypothetical protein
MEAIEAWLGRACWRDMRRNICLQGCGDRHRNKTWITNPEEKESLSMVSADNPTWSLAHEHSLALEVILLKRTYVLPWSQFLYAEGGNDEVRVAFTTHDILLKGGNLGPLVAALASHAVKRLQEPARPDRFWNGTGPFIREISVERIEPDRA